jgi:TolB-like protein/DNA-binding winged helix-turn-helix (wHTH) protein
LATPVIQFEDVEIDLARFEVRRGGVRVHLEKQPFDLLVLLLRTRGDLVPRKEIAETLWGSNVFVETDRSINNAIRKIRLALGDDPEHPRFIETVAGRGYRFIASVSFSSESQPESIPQQTVSRDGNRDGPNRAGHQSARGREVDLSGLSLSEPAPVSAIARPRKRWQSAAALASIVAIVLAIAFLLVKWKDRLPFTAKAQIDSLAVLPLANLSGDPAQEYFADGMTEELTTEVAQVSGLRVTSRTSVMVYKNARKPLPQIARELNVDAVVEGSVLRLGNQVRISAQLIQADGDRHLWAESYDRDLNDILGLQKDVAREIARQIHAKLTPEEVAPSAQHKVDPEAHDAYLQGRYHANKQTEKEVQTAIDYFQRAVSRDPTFAPAYAGLADCYLSLATAYRAPREVMPSAKASALKALELYNSLSEAHSSLGSVYFYYDWDWPATEREAKRALALNSNNECS